MPTTYSLDGKRIPLKDRDIFIGTPYNPLAAEETTQTPPPLVTPETITPTHLPPVASETIHELSAKEEQSNSNPTTLPGSIMAEHHTRSETAQTNPHIATETTPVKPPPAADEALPIILPPSTTDLLRAGILLGQEDPSPPAAHNAPPNDLETPPNPEDKNSKISST